MNKTTGSCTCTTCTLPLYKVLFAAEYSEYWSTSTTTLDIRHCNIQSGYWALLGVMLFLFVLLGTPVLQYCATGSPVLI
jgi:hypothetical protein